MRDFKNIDRLFQENLKDFEVFPPNKSWNKIEKKLGPQKKRRLPIWMKVASVAALFALFFSVGTIYFLPENNITKNFIPKFIDKNNLTSDKDSLKNTTSLSKKKSTIKNKSVSENIEDTQNNIITASNNNTAETSEALKEESVFKKKILSKNSLVDAKNLPLTNSVDPEISKKETLNERFTVATIYAPIYYNSLGDGSGVDAQFKDNPTSGNSSYSYGVKFAYQLNNKFSLQSGVNLINLGYKTNDVYVAPGVAVVGLSHLSSSPIASKTNSNSKDNGFSSDSNKGSLNQVFGYVEIPVELKYNVANGKLGVNLVGGFSTLLLNKDEIFVETNSFTQSLGASNSLRSINFSGNIGVDVDYLIHKNLYINIAPMFKVQANTFSKNSSSTQPYYLGVYTGLNYKF